MKRSITLLAILALLAAGIYCFILARKPAPATVETVLAKPAVVPTPAPLVTDPNKPVPAAPSNLVAVAPTPFVPTNPTNIPAPVIAPETDVQTPSSLPESTVAANVRSAVRQYNQMWGGNPVGTNPEITSALSGNNPKHINFINTEAGMRVNGSGEMVDNWGTPYFFHQMSANEMEIHSAGPDKIMWTADDIVAR